MNCVEIWNVWIECANQRNRSRPEFLLSPSPDNLQLVVGWTNSQETSQFSILVEELVTDYSGRLSCGACCLHAALGMTVATFVPYLT